MSKLVARDRLEAFFEVSMSLLCTADAETNTFIDLNPAWESVLGWTRDELRSRPFMEFIHPDDLAPTFAVIQDMMDRQLDAVNFENRYLHKDGHWVWLSWFGRIRNGSFYSTAHDITAYKESERRLEAANEELRHIAYAASHDLAEPLRGITGHLSFIAEQEVAPEVQDRLKFVKAAADRMQALLDGLLRLSRIDSAGHKGEVMSLLKPLHDALEVLSDRVAETGANVVVQGAWPALRIDPAQIAQVFQNLLSNSMKYADGPPEIIVSAVAVDAGFRFTVVDNGVGFEPSRADRAFQLFQRLHRRSKYPGMGIGLALVKRIVLRHAGDIGIESAVGKGTTVWFWLPQEGLR